MSGSPARKWRRLALGLALLLLAYLLLAFFLQRPALFMGTTITAPPQRPPADALVVTLGSGDTVEAWYLPPLAGGPGPHPALLFAHGNGELIDHYPGAFTMPRRWGMGVLLVEYPGYGRSQGDPTEETVRAAMVNGYDWLAAREDIDGTRIVALGRSLGGGAVCALSRQRQPAALLTVSTFTSFGDMLPRFGVPGAFARDKFDNLGALDAYGGPVFVAHGRQDQLIPFAHATRLAEVANVQVHEMPGSHNDNPLPWPAIRRFLVQARMVADLSK